MYNIKNRSIFKKIFVYTLLMMCTFTPSLSKAEVIKGSIEKVWSADTARKEAFKNAKEWIDLSKYSSTDPNFNENKDLINKNQLKHNGRRIKYFSDGWYSVSYNNIYTEDYYYSEDGELQEIGFSVFSKNIYTLEDTKKYSPEELYPITCYKHSYPGGKLTEIILDANGYESFIFEPNGKLVGHWIGNNFYDEQNNLIMTRSD